MSGRGLWREGLGLLEKKGKWEWWGERNKSKISRSIFTKQFYS